MATTLYFRKNIDTDDCVVATGTQYTNLRSSAVSWYRQSLSTSRGATATYTATSTVAGATPGVECCFVTTSSPLIFISPPLAADVTVSGSIMFNLRAVESAKYANVAINCRIMRLSGANLTLAEVHKTVRTTELGYSAEGANNWAETPSSYTFHKGDRIVLIPFGDDAGTMASGYTFTFWWDGPTGGASGDSYVTFTETITFSSAPAGTTIYPTGTGAGIDPGAATELEAWTSRGGGVATAVTNTAAGPTSPIQITATGGGTAVEWYTKQLTACTLAGAVLANLRGLVSVSYTTNANFRCEIAVCASDGTGAVVWGTGEAGSGATYYEMLLDTAEAAATFFIQGDDVAISDSQRLRVRIFIDDGYGYGDAMAASRTCTFYYAGSAGATGDSYLTFPITLTEYSAAAGEDVMPYVGGGYYPV
jgi:hypothetical protein